MLLTEYDEKQHLKNVYQEGREEASERINKLIILLMEDGRTDDLMKAAKDSTYQEKLFKEYKI